MTLVVVNVITSFVSHYLKAAEKKRVHKGFPQRYFFRGAVQHAVSRDGQQNAGINRLLGVNGAALEFEPNGTGRVAVAAT